MQPTANPPFNKDPVLLGDPPTSPRPPLSPAPGSCAAMSLSHEKAYSASPRPPTISSSPVIPASPTPRQPDGVPGVFRRPVQPSCLAHVADLRTRPIGLLRPNEKHSDHGVGHPWHKKRQYARHKHTARTATDAVEVRYGWVTSVFAAWWTLSPAAICSSDRWHRDDPLPASTDPELWVSWMSATSRRASPFLPLVTSWGNVFTP